LDPTIIIQFSAIRWSTKQHHLVLIRLSGLARVAHLFDKFPFWVNEVIRRIDHYRRVRIVRTDMSKRKENPRARIAIRGLNDHHPGRPVPELRPCFPRVQSDDHDDFTLRLSQQIRLAKLVLSIDLLPRRVQNCVGLGRLSQR